MINKSQACNEKRGGNQSNDTKKIGHTNVKNGVTALALGVLMATTNPPSAEAQNHTPKIEQPGKQKIDFVSYLGEWGEIYQKMQPDKRQIFENIYNQILRDNGESVVLTGRGKTVKIETSKSIHSLMRNLCYFLYNLDAKEVGMVKFYNKLIKQIEKGRSMGLKINDDIMNRFHGFKIFAEHIDKEREGWLNTPLKREKELREIQKRIAELEKDIARLDKNIARLDKNIARLDKNIARLDAELKVLKIVVEGLKAMKNM